MGKVHSIKGSGCYFLNSLFTIIIFKFHFWSKKVLLKMWYLGKDTADARGPSHVDMGPGMGRLSRRDPRSEAPEAGVGTGGRCGRGPAAGGAEEAGWSHLYILVKSLRLLCWEEIGWGC